MSSWYYYRTVHATKRISMGQSGPATGGQILGGYASGLFFVPQCRNVSVLRGEKRAHEA